MAGRRKGHGNAEYEERLGVVEEALLEGREPSAIAKTLVEEYKISIRQAQLDIQTVQDRWKKADKELRKKKHYQYSRARALRRRELLFSRAIDENDLRLAWEVEKDRSEMVDLYPAKKQELTGAAGGPLALEIVEEIIDAPPSSPQEIPTPPSAGGV